MAITLSEIGQNGACNGLVDLVDAGAGPGLLNIKDSTDAILVSIALAKPAFGEAVAGVAEATGLPRAGAGLIAGVPAAYDVTDSEGNVVWSGTIPSSMTIDAETISPRQIVSVTNWIHTQPAR